MARKSEGPPGHALAGSTARAYLLPAYLAGTVAADTRARLLAAAGAAHARFADRLAIPDVSEEYIDRVRFPARVARATSPRHSSWPVRTLATTSRPRSEFAVRAQMFTLVDNRNGDEPRA